MANTLRFKRGLASGLPTGLAGEPLFTTDTFDLYIGNGTGNTRFQKFIASGTTSQLLRGDGSLLTMPIVLSSPANGEVLKYNGTNWVNSNDAGITGSLTTNYIPKATSASTLGNSLIYDDGTTIGIGTTSVNSNEKLRIQGGRLNVLGNSEVYQFKLSYNSATSGFWFGSPSANALAFYNDAGTERARFDSSGNFGIGTASPLEKLQVNGALRITGAVTNNTTGAILSYEGSGGSLLGAWGVDASTRGFLRFYLANSTGTIGTEYMRLNNTGNLLLGNVASDNGLRFQVTGDGYFSGSVGIGASPAAKLDILATGSADIIALRYPTLGKVAGIYLDSANVYYGAGANNFTNAFVAGHTTNVLTLRTAGTVRATLDASGNLGLGVTPSAWGSNTAFQIGNGAIWKSGSRSVDWMTNGYYNGTNYIYNQTAAATYYRQYDGSHQFWNAPSGTAGNAITFTQAMTLDASGNLGIGTTSPSVRTQIDSTGFSLRLRETSDGSGLFLSGNQIQARTSAGTGTDLYLNYTSGGSIWMPGSGTNLIIGSLTSSGERLQVTGTAKITSTLSVGDTSTTNVINVTGATASNAELRFFNGATRQMRFASRGDISQVLIDADTWDLGIRTIGSKFIFFSTNGTERMRLDASGNLGLGVTPSAWGGTAFQTGVTGINNFGATTRLINNAYYTSGNSPIYIVSNFASSYEQVSGQHKWLTAASGTGGATITFTQAMTLDASGNLGIGVSPTQRLHVAGNSLIVGGATWTTGTVATQFFGDIYGSIKYDYNTTNFTINSYGLFSIATNGTSPTTKFTIFANGNTAIGTTTDAGYKLDVNGTMRVSGASTLSGGVTLGHTGGVAVTFPGGQAFRSNGGIFIDYGNGGTGDLVFRRGAGVTNTLTLAVADGAATFSSSVTAGARYIVSAASSAGISDISYGSLSGGAWINTPSATNGYLAVAGNAALRWSASELNFYVSAAEAMRLDANGFGIGGVPAQKLDVQGSANSIQARFGNVAGRGLTIGTSAISGTNDAGVVFNAPTATDGTLVFQTSSTDRMTLNSSGLNVATAIAIGTTPDTNLPFKILKNINSTVGIRFENTSTGASSFTGYQFGTDVSGGTAFTNFLYASSGVTETGVYKPNGTALINTGSGGLNFLAVSQPIRFFTSTGNGTLRAAITNDGDFTQYNGTNPSASTTDAFRMYSADITAGNAAPHFRTENGGIIKLYQQTTGVTSATYIGGAGTGLTDSDTFDGYTIAQIVKALRNAGLLA